MSCRDCLWAKQFPEFGKKPGGGRDREIVRKKQDLALSDMEEDLRFAGMF
jgi:hypothetical protein